MTHAFFEENMSQNNPVEITIKDIARICGVGVSTVSRAINNHSDINTETKEKIMEAIDKYGYIPNNSARNLKRTAASTIAILVKGITNPFFSDMIKIIEEYAGKRKYSVELRHVEYNEDEVDVASTLVKEKKLQGIVFLGGFFNHSEEKLGKLSIPFVMATAGCTPEYLNKSKYSSYTVDDEIEGYKVTDYLISLGHKKIAILCGERGITSVGQLRLKGYKRALKDAGIEINESLICPMKDDVEYYSLQNGYETMKDLLDVTRDITAVFAISDVLAIGACRAIKDAGLRVPEDISVVGYDGIEMGRFVNPSLTTLKQPVEKIAKASAELIFEMIEGETTHSHRTFEGELIERESTCRANR